MADNRVQARIDLVKGTDDTNNVKSSLGDLSNKVDGLKDSVTRAGEATSGTTGLLGSFGESLKHITEVAIGVGLEKLTEKIVDLGKEAATFAFTTATSFEQTANSFETILGSADKAGQLLTQLSNWEVHTPFKLGDITDAAKEMLAFGAKQSDILPKLQEFSDMSMGNTQRFKELVSIWGEVNSLQEVNGRTILRLSSIGIPIFPALGQAMASAGNAGTAMGTSIEKGTKMSAASMTALQHNISETQAQLKILNEEHVKAGTATDKHNLAIMKATNNLAEYQAKLAGANKVVKTGGSAKGAVPTEKELRDMMSHGDITPEIFNKALESLTSKGGMFFGETARQAGTLSGVMTSVESQFQRLALGVMGVGINGQIDKNGLFAKLKNSASDVLEFLIQHKDDIIAFGKNITDAIGKVADYIQKNIVPVMGKLGDIIRIVGDHIKTAFTPVWDHLLEVYQKHKDTIDKLAYILGAVLYGALTVIITVVGKAIDIFLSWADVMLTVFKPGIDMVYDAIGALGKQWDNILSGMSTMFDDLVNRVINGINSIIDSFNKLSGLNMGKIPLLGAQPSMPNVSSGGPALNYTPANYSPGVGSSSTNNKNVNIYNSNSFVNPFDPIAVAKFMAWQINGAMH